MERKVVVSQPGILKVPVLLAASGFSALLLVLSLLLPGLWLHQSAKVAAALLYAVEPLFAFSAGSALLASLLLLRQCWREKTLRALGRLLALSSLQLLWLTFALLALLISQYIRWAGEVERQGVQQGTALNAAQQALASEVGVRQAAQVRLVYVEQVPFPLEQPALKFLGETLGFVGDGIINNAQVFGYSIYVRQGFVLNRPKLAHELVHVRQVEDSSFQSITLWHMLDLVLYGYQNSRIEAEAFLANEQYPE